MVSAKERAKESGALARVRAGTRKVAKVAKMEGRTRGRKAVARKEGKEETRTRLTCDKTGHIAVWCRKGRKNNLYAIDENDSENIEEPADNEKDLQAWCLLEESENEQWQEVISRRDKQTTKKANQASLMSVENSNNSCPKKIVEVKDRWVKVSVPQVM